MPLNEIEDRLRDLPDEAEIVAYCRGPYCVFADDALEFLESKGLKGSRLDIGVLEWELAGHSTES